MADEGAQQGLAPLQPTAIMTGGCRQCGKIEEGEVGQRIGLQVAPDHFHWVELRSVGRKQDRVEAGGSLEILGDSPTPMNPGCGFRGSPQAVPDQDHRGMDLPAQLAKEVDDLGCGDVGLGTEPEVQLDLIAGGGHTQSSKDGDFLVGARALRQKRSVAAGRPASSNQGGHQKAGFVEENQAGSQAGGFFLARGHSCLTQRWISASSRSTARRCGFCGLQPRLRRRRPMWSTW